MCSSVLFSTGVAAFEVDAAAFSTTVRRIGMFVEVVSGQHDLLRRTHMALMLTCDLHVSMVLHRAVVAACDQEGLKLWLAAASILPFARHRVPLPWHRIVEYGYLAADKSRLQAAFRKHGLETNARRGILRCWFATGEPVRVVFGSRVLETCRSQTWP